MFNLSIFEGLRILDLTRVMSGPYCTAMLGDLGGDIIKIEMPEFGEEGRFFAPHIKGESTYFAMLNRGKRSVTVNMKKAEGRQLIHQLALKADIIVENFRPGVMKRLGLGADVLRNANKRLIYASISGFGNDSPYKDWPAFDLVVQAMSGLMHITGEREGRPTAVGESLADVATGMFAAFGIAAALYEREKTGLGKHLEIAMLDSVFSMLITGLSRKLYTQKPTRRVGNRHPETYPVDSFKTKDGGEIVLVGFTDEIFHRIAKAIGKPEISQDEKFKTNAERNKHEQELYSLIAAWANGLNRDEAISILRQHDVTAAPVWSFEELLASGHIEARDLIRTGHNKILGDIALVPQPVRFSGEIEKQNVVTSPILGEHTDDVLRHELGLGQKRINALRQAGVI